MTDRTQILWLGAVLTAAAPCAAAERPDTDLNRAIGRLEPGGLSDSALADLSDAELARLVDLGAQAKSEMKARMTHVQRIERAVLKPWVVFGFAAQFAFMLRFVVQLIASERKKRSYVPVAFWYLSLVGGAMLLVYALKLRDPVFVAGQGLGCAIYVRNLLLIRRRGEACRDLKAARRKRETGDCSDSASGVAFDTADRETQTSP